MRIQQRHKSLGSEGLPCDSVTDGAWILRSRVEKMARPLTEESSDWAAIGNNHMFKVQSES